MTLLAATLLAALPCVYWTEGIDTRPILESAGIKRVCVAPELVDAWRNAGFAATPVTTAEFDARETLPPPGVTSVMAFRIRDKRANRKRAVAADVDATSTGSVRGV